MTDEKKLSLDEIKARVQVVCICKGVRMARMCEAIARGATTVAEVHRATRSGDGGCGATRCTPVIQALLDNGGRPVTNLQELRRKAGRGDDDRDNSDIDPSWT